MQKQVAILGIVLLSQQFVDFNNKQIVVVLRTLFICLSAAIYLGWQRIAETVERKKDARVIWVKKTAAPSLASMTAMFTGAAADADAVAEWRQTTYHELEKEKAAAALSTATTGPLINLAMSMWMGACA